MQFRIADVIYLFTLLATSFAAFGPLGLFVALFVEFVWLVVLKRLKVTYVELLVVIAIVGTLVGLLIPASMASRESVRIAICRDDLSHIARALLAVAAADGRLPQAIIPDDQGQPMHSWRTSILSQIDQTIAGAYDRAQPWDSPKNSTALNATFSQFDCPSDPPSQGSAQRTNYFAVVGPQTAWPEDRGLALSEITDGREATLLLLEVAGWEVPWGEPRDLTCDEALSILLGKSRPSNRFAAATYGPVVHHHYGRPGYFYKWHATDRPGVHAAFADGKVRYLPIPLPEQMAKALLTANAGDQVDWEEFDRLTAPQLDYAKIYATLALAVVALWPVRRLLRRRPLQ